MALCLLLAPDLNGVYVGSREGADLRGVEGVRSVVDGLGPGLSVNISLPGGPAADPVALVGHAVYCSNGDWSVSLPTTWPSSGAVLYPGIHYSLSLIRGEVEVRPVG